VGQPAVLATYCSALESKCAGTFNINATTCGNAMSGVTLGDQMDGDTNSIGCRMKYLNAATVMCRYAGPSGGGRCGAMISNVCDIATNVCVTSGLAASQSVTPSYATSALCQAAAPGIGGMAHQWGSVQGLNGAGQNSLECRLYHAINADSSGDASHCTHYALSGGPCTGKVTTDRAHYCDTLMYNCGNSSDTYAQFADADECNATAAGYPNAMADDATTVNGGNNLGCREYHAQASAALGAGPTHCEHAGPSGAGVCGLRFQAWASILAAAPCSDTSVQMFIGAVGNATANLAVPPGNVAGTLYSTTTGSVNANSQVCRIYHLGVASTHYLGPTGHCSHGSIGGAGQCGVLVNNACDFISGICGYGANATYQYASQAACITGLTNSATNNVTVGPPGDAAGNTLECRFYHAAVAASFLPTGSQGNTPGAAANVVTHCSHVLQIAPAGGCGYVAPVPAPTPKASAAATLPLLASVLVVAGSLVAL